MLDVIIEIVRPLLEGIVANTGQLGLAVALLASVLYYRKVTGAVSAVGGIMGKLVFSAAIIGVLLLAGVITGIDVAQTIEYGRVMLDWGWSLIQRFDLLG